MNNQKDTSKGHNIVQNDMSKNNEQIIDLFKNSFERTLFVTIKKIEKIVAAVYLVTDVMDDSVPLTKTLRTQSLETLTLSYGLLHAPASQLRQMMSRAVVRLDEAASLVRIGAIAHHISPMNADIIDAELSKVITVMADLALQTADIQMAFGGSPALPVQPIIPSDVLRDTAFDEARERIQSKRHQNDIKTTLLTKNDKEEVSSADKTTLLKNPQVSHDRIDRKQQIMNALKAKQPATLNDIKLLVRDVSDKTLQREMSTLVEMGIIAKEGNKRWTTYRIV